MSKRTSKTNKWERKEQVKRVAKECSISQQLAQELLILAGGDEDLVIKSSLESNGLGHCRANIINARLGELNG